jgi:ATP-dependent DNA helicase HFM1/MER3
MQKVLKAGHGALINVKAEIGFMNEKPPIVYGKKLIYVVFLAETSDGHKVHFVRIRQVLHLSTSSPQLTI